jgi:ABC-2 type transport system permease protein
MRGIIKFGLTELKLVLKDKSFYFWAMVLPVFFVFIFSGIGNDNKGKESKTIVYIKNLDKGDYSKELVNNLKKEKLSLKFDKKGKKVARELIIPSDFSKKIKDKKKVVLKFKVKGTKLNTYAIQAKISLYRAIYKFLIKKYLGIEKPKQILSIKSEWAGRASYIPSGIIHQMPATIITFLLFNLLIFGGTNFVKLRERGMLERFVITPLGKKGMWFGLFLTNMFVAFIVVIMIIITSSLLFSVSFGMIPLLNMLFVLMIFSTFVASLSIYMGSVLKKAEAVIGVAVLLANLLAALGGCWWPIEIVPDFMKKIAMVLPTGWAMAASDKLLFYKTPFSSVVPHLFVLIGFTIAFGLLSVKFFNIEKT